MRRLTVEDCVALNMSMVKIKQAIDAGRMKGKKVSDRIYLIDESELPATSQSSTNEPAKSNPDNKVPTAVQEAEDAVRIAEANRRKQLIEKGYSDIFGIHWYTIIVNGKVVKLHNDTILILESFRTHPRQTYDDLLKVIHNDLLRYKASYKRQHNTDGKFIKEE